MILDTFGWSSWCPHSSPVLSPGKDSRSNSSCLALAEIYPRRCSSPHFSDKEPKAGRASPLPHAYSAPSACCARLSMLSQSCTQDSLVGSVWAFLYQAIPEAAALVPLPPPLTELMGSWGCPVTAKLAVETLRLSRASPLLISHSQAKTTNLCGQLRHLHIPSWFSVTHHGGYCIAACSREQRVSLYQMGAELIF